MLLNIIGLIAVHSLKHIKPELQRFPLSMLALTFLLGIIVQAASLWHRHPKWSWYHNTAVALFAPLALAGANRPFLIHGELSLTAAYGAQAYGRAGIIGLLIIFPVILVGLILFVSLLRTDKN